LKSLLHKYSVVSFIAARASERQGNFTLLV
jgi:hypothetical protein